MTQNLPDPAGAVHVDDWDPRAEGTRTFSGSSWQVPVAEEGNDWIVLASANIAVQIYGIQWPSGTIFRWVVVTFPAGLGGSLDRYDLPIASARMLAESLAAAVAEADRMCIADGGTMTSFPTFSAVDR